MDSPQPMLCLLCGSLLQSPGKRRREGSVAACVQRVLHVEHVGLVVGCSKMGRGAWALRASVSRGVRHRVRRAILGRQAGCEEGVLMGGTQPLRRSAP